MEKQYSVQFFAHFVENLQRLCQKHIDYSQFVEVSGYVSVEIDNMKKERYVLSELLQSSGNVVSESYCTKAFTTHGNAKQATGTNLASRTYCDRNEYVKENRNIPNKFVRQKPRSRPYPVVSQSVYDTSQSVPEASVMYKNVSQSSSQPYKPAPHPEDDSDVQNVFSNQSHMESSDFKDERPRIHEVRTVTGDQFVYFNKTDPDASTDVEDVIDLDLEDDDDEDSQVDLPSPSFTESQSDIIHFPMPQKEVNPGSLSVMKSALRRFKSFHFDKCGQDIDLVSTQPSALNQLLLDYFQGARKQDGGVIMAGSLRTVQMYLDRYLKEQGYPYSITKDVRFRTSRDYLKLKLDEEEKNKTHLKPIPVDDRDIEIMFQTNILGSHSCETLINTMWFMVSKYFGIRRPMEHINFKWGDLRLGENPNGEEYLERIVNNTFSLKEFAKPDNPNRCFVNYYKQYRALRPKLAMAESSPFYLKINKGQGQESYMSDENMSYSYSSNIWRKIILASGLPQRKKIL